MGCCLLRVCCSVLIVLWCFDSCLRCFSGVLRIGLLGGFALWFMWVVAGLLVLLTWLVGLVVWLLICCFVIYTVEFAVMLVARCFGVFTVLGLFVGGWVVYLGGIWLGGLVWCLGCLGCIYFVVACFGVWDYCLVCGRCLGASLGFGCG